MEVEDVVAVGGEGGGAGPYPRRSHHAMERRCSGECFIGGVASGHQLGHMADLMGWVWLESEDEECTTTAEQWG